MRIPPLLPLPLILTISLLLGACTEGDGDESDLDTVATGSEVLLDRSGADGASDVVTIDPDAPASLEDLIPFRGNTYSIEQTMATVPGTQKKEGGDRSRLSYTGGRFADLPVAAWDFGFYGGQMTFAQLQFRTEETGIGLEALYERLSEEMTERYGAMMFDSDRQVSRNLSKYTKAETAFIEKVGLSIQAGKFRMWTPTDSTADVLITLNMLPNDPTMQQGVLHLAWYDRIQGEAFFRAIEKNQ